MPFIVKITTPVGRVFGKTFDTLSQAMDEQKRISQYGRDNNWPRPYTIRIEEVD